MRSLGNLIARVVTAAYSRGDTSNSCFEQVSELKSYGAVHVGRDLLETAFPTAKSIPYTSSPAIKWSGSSTVRPHACTPLRV